MIAPSASRVARRSIALAGALVLAAAVRANAAGPAVTPALLDFDSLGPSGARTFRVSDPGYRGRLAVTISSAAVAKIVPAYADARAGATAIFTVVPLHGGRADVTFRDGAGRTAAATVAVTAVTLLLHDVPAVARSVRIEARSLVNGSVSDTNANINPASSRSCVAETGGTRCVVTAGVTPGATRLRVTFFGPRGRPPALAITQHVTTFAAAANTVRDLSSATFLNYFPLRGSPVGSVAQGPLGDEHVWFVTQALHSQRIVRASTSGATTSYATPQTNGYVALASGNSRLLWFGLSSATRSEGLQAAYVGAITVGGTIDLSATPTDATCGVRYEPLSIAVGPEGSPWFLETLCRTIGIGTLAGGTLLNYPMPLDVYGSAIYSAQAYQHEIATGADGALWFFVTQCGLNGYVCSPAAPPRGAIGHATTRGALSFVALPPGRGCVGGFVAPGGDGNIWFAQPCTPAGVPPYFTTTVGRIDPTGHISEYFGLSSAANDIAEGPDGDVYLSTTGGIARVVTRGTHAGRIDEYLSPRGPSEIDSVGAGPDGKLYATDALNRFDRIAVPSHPDR
jgi:streptogramin lyase